MSRPYLRESLLLLGFIAVLALSVVAVVLPELSREPDAVAPSQKSTAEPGGSAQQQTPSP